MEYSGHSQGDSGFVGDRLKLTGAGGWAEPGGPDFWGLGNCGGDYTQGPSVSQVSQ